MAASGWIRKWIGARSAEDRASALVRAAAGGDSLDLLLDLGVQALLAAGMRIAPGFGLWGTGRGNRAGAAWWNDRRDLSPSNGSILMFRRPFSGRRWKARNPCGSNSARKKQSCISAPWWGCAARSGFGCGRGITHLDWPWWPMHGPGLIRTWRFCARGRTKLPLRSGITVTPAGWNLPPKRFTPSRAFPGRFCAVFPRISSFPRSRTRPGITCGRSSSPWDAEVSRPFREKVGTDPTNGPPQSARARCCSCGAKLLKQASRVNYLGNPSRRGRVPCSTLPLRRWSEWWPFPSKFAIAPAAC